MLALYKSPGRRAKELASDTRLSRRDVNIQLYNDLSEYVVQGSDHRWWPEPFYETDEWSRNQLESRAQLIVAARKALRKVPRTIDPRGPLDLLLELPYGPRVRFYVFPVKIPESFTSRAYIGLTIGGRPGDGKRSFDRSDGYRPSVVGYCAEEKVFVIWDAGIYEWGGGFRYNRPCYVGQSTILEAMATGSATEKRSIRKPNVTETVVACRQDRFLDGLLSRQQFTDRRIING